MADVFISYSRRDKDFVQQLNEALSKRGREAWVDWEGIPPTAEFMQEIFGAIEGSDTFIYVLTPNSVVSKVCRDEIAHAVAQNKRMIPIVARDVDAAEVPEPLAKLNWIFFRDSDVFDTAVDTLIKALDTDLDWIRAHTRLLRRAVEWEAKRRNNSFVLRGDDLRAAEQWLTEAGADKERQPTALQTAYIIASRKAAARRQRITLGAVSFGLVVAMLLAILAYLSRQESHRRLVGATVMAGQERIDRGDLFDALPYFVEALKLDLSDQLREPLHRVRLGTTFRQLPQLAAAFFHHNQIGTAELSADGEWLLTTADEPAATLRHLADGGERELKLAERVSVGAFSANGRYVVLRGQKSEAISSMLTPLKGWKDAGAQVWEVATGAPVRCSPDQVEIRR